ncbi:periplasmic heavy metal sensor, partial [uncultured Bilophila sp.]
MKTRAFVAALAFSALILGTGVSAFAYHGYGHPYGGPNGMASLPSDKQDAYDAMMKEHYNRVSPLRDKLESKRIELDALSRNPNA